MRSFSKSIQCFFQSDNLQRKLVLGGQTIDYKSLEKYNVELIEYTICYSLLECLSEINSNYISYLDELKDLYKRDISILYLIEIIFNFLEKEKIKITNIAIHLTMQKPRLSRPDLNLNYKIEIRNYLSRIFNLDLDDLVVQAGTGEKIGEIGNSNSIIIICNLGLESLIKEKTKRVGFGYDRHRFEDDVKREEKKPTICGQKINYDKSISAHSDGDVVLHALVNAIFSTIGLGDIGEHFPDTDPEWKGANSIKFVIYAMEKLKEKNYKIGFIKIILISSERLKDFIEVNHQNFVMNSVDLISRVCEIDKNLINFSIRLANEDLIDKDEKCIKNDEGIDANVKIKVDLVNI